MTWPPGSHRTAGSPKPDGRLAEVDPAGFTEQALRLRALSTERWGPEQTIEMVGRSEPLLELQKKIEKVARYREPVLITGESGVGKEALAQSIYLLGDASHKPFVSVNCPQYQEGNLTVSELFGHARGSFTGAIADRRGAFEEADGGVIFLDEIGDLQSSAQAMLLRALSTGEFRPLGASRPRKVDVRVISATNRSLNSLVMTNEFRYDLFFRLARFHVTVPPLRDRGDDWLLIVEHCLMRLRHKYGVRKRLSAAATRVLQAYNWPGNVRQLINLVTTGYAMADGDVIEPPAFLALLDGDALNMAVASPRDRGHRRRAVRPHHARRRRLLGHGLSTVHGPRSQPGAGQRGHQEGVDSSRAQLPHRARAVPHARGRLPALHGLPSASRAEAVTEPAGTSQR